MLACLQIGAVLIVALLCVTFVALAWIGTR